MNSRQDSFKRTAAPADSISGLDKGDMSSANKVGLQCEQCELPIDSEKYMKCSSCYANYHFTPCCAVRQSSYAGMSADGKSSWKCHRCRERKNSNTSYQIVLSQEENSLKQKRNETYEGDEEEVLVDVGKRFKNSTSTNPPQTKNAEGGDPMQIMLQNISQMTIQLASIGTQLQNQQITLTLINENVTQLANQVSDLQNQNKEKDKKITEMDSKINKLEQKLIEKNLEIRNINNDNMSATEVVKKIATKVNANVCDNDIENAYRTKKNGKIFVEFRSLRTKRELMDQIKKHKRGGAEININDDDENSNNNNHIYINDQLTYQNRRLLWLAKTKAKEANWKFVWMRNGGVCARKNEKSSFININNESDIELIC